MTERQRIRAQHRISMRQLVREQKAARAELREEQRRARAQQMADQKAERDLLRADTADRLASVGQSADVFFEDFEVCACEQAPAMPGNLAAAVFRLHGELAA